MGRNCSTTYYVHDILGDKVQFGVREVKGSGGITTSISTTKHVFIV